VSGEDIIVGKTVPMPEDPSGGAQRFQKKDASLALRNAESGVIDQVLVTTGDQGTRFIKVGVGV
jgi:DNA-directed RNA polymerase II subunit RPB2